MRRVMKEVVHAVVERWVGVFTKAGVGRESRGLHERHFQSVGLLTEGKILLGAEKNSPVA